MRRTNGNHTWTLMPVSDRTAEAAVDPADHYLPK